MDIDNSVVIAGGGVGIGGIEELNSNIRNFKK